MKFLKPIALSLVLCMILMVAVACGKPDGGAETTVASGDTTAAPETFMTSIKVIALDENGDEVVVLEDEEAVYNGLKPITELTASDIVADYCADNEIAYTLSDVTGRLATVDGYPLKETGYIWSYIVNEETLSDYDTVVANGSEVIVKLIKAE